MTLLVIAYRSCFAKAVSNILFDFEVAPTHKEGAVLGVEAIWFSCYKDVLVATLVLGKPSTRIAELASEQAMLSALLSFDQIVESYSDIKEIFKAHKNTIESAHSIVLELEFNTFVSIMEQRFS